MGGISVEGVLVASAICDDGDEILGGAHSGHTPPTALLVHYEGPSEHRCHGGSSDERGWLQVGYGRVLEVLIGREDGSGHVSIEGP